MTVPETADPQLQQTEELLRAAQVLLTWTVDLDAIRVLHAEISRRLAAMPPGPPSRSWAEARLRQQALLEEWERRCVGRPPLGPLDRVLRGAPRWFWRAAGAFLLLALTARYAWRVTYGKDWNQQNPEGNWVSRFYQNDTFAGYPMVRYDTGVNADFGSGAPADAMKKDGFSVRWDTCLIVAKDIVAPLELTADDSARLFVDEQPQLEVTPGPGTKAASVSFHPGTHHVRVDFVERRGMAMVRLGGFEPDGSEAYSFRRPVIEGQDVKCL
jgi:hypothetical protein